MPQFGTEALHGMTIEFCIDETFQCLCSTTQRCKIITVAVKCSFGHNANNSCPNQMNIFIVSRLICYPE